MTRNSWLGSARVVCVAAGLAIAGCGDSTGPALEDLVITTASTGLDIAPAGYLVVVEDLGTQPIGPSGTVRFEDVPEGSYVVQLAGIPANCTLAGTNPRTVDTGSGDPLAGRFELTCVRNIGSIEITAVSDGTDVPDGYTLSVGGTTSESVDANGTTVLDEVPAGARSVELTGVPDNCSVAGENPRTVTIPVGGVATTSFDVTCAANVGGLEVLTSTTGGNLDPDGYTVVVTGGSSLAVGLNDAVTFQQVTAGDVSVELTDLAANCTVNGDNPRTVTVAFGETASTTFAVDCDPNGDLSVTTATTGMNFPAGFTVTVVGQPNQVVEPNGTTVFVDLPADDYQVELTDLPDHCEVVNGPALRTVTVSAGSGSTTFEVTCWGWLVYDSDRNGNWDIITMRHDGSQQINLTQSSLEDERQPVVSPDGTKIAFMSTRTGTEHVYVMNRDGTGVVQLTTDGQNNKEPAWSPDGSKIIFSRRESSQWDVWMMNPNGTNLVNLTNNPAWDARGELSPDGTRLVFDSDRSGTRTVWVMDVDGTNLEQLTTDGAGNPTWSPDGSKITFTSLPPAPATVDIWIMDADGSNQRNLTNRPNTADGESAWSFDGTTIAFMSSRDGDAEIFLMDPDGSNQRQVTFNNWGDLFPSWSP